MLITAIGVSYFLQNAALLIWSSNPKSFPTHCLGSQVRCTIGSAATITRATALLTIVVCVVIMIGLTLFTSKTKMGKAMRACS